MRIFCVSLDMDRSCAPKNRSVLPRTPAVEMMYTGERFLSVEQYVNSSPSLCAVLLSFLLVGGCSIYSVPGGEPAPAEKAPESPEVAPPATTPQPAPRPVEPSASKAYQPLLDKAGQARDRGDYEQALALLERAQRIDPDSADIYLAMARTHDARGDRAQARATAERGLLYCSGRAQCDALRLYTR